MTIRVKLFAGARELADRGEIAVTIADHATVADLRAALVESAPRLAPLAARSMVAVNACYATDATRVSADDDIALIPPVSGG